MLYRPGQSRLHRAEPLTKLALIVLAASMLPLWPAPVLLGAAALAVAAGMFSGIGGPLMRRLALLLAPVALALIAVHGFLLENGPPRAFGPLEYYPQGLARGLGYFARIALLLSVSLLAVMTTRIGDLARALDDKGLPAALAYLLTAPLNLIESIALEAGAIRDSLQVRGLAASQGFAARARLLAALIGPLVRNLIAEAGPRAEALDGRGFRALPRRSLAQPIQTSRPEAALRLGLLLLAAAQLAALALWA